MEDDTPKVRVRFVTKDDTIRVTDTPLAIPTKLGRKGLGEVVNHLLGSNDDPVKLDFLVEEKLLRSSLAKFLRTTGISTEATVTIEYFRSLPDPAPGPSSPQSTDWVGALQCLGEGVVVSGTYGGKLQLYEGKSCKLKCEVHAHEGPIKAVRGRHQGELSVCYTASKDRCVKSWSVEGEGKGVRQLWQGVGHETSVEALALAPQGLDKLISGDWSGLLFVWDLNSDEDGPTGTGEDAGASTSKKKRKGGKGETAAPIREKTFKGRIKAHAQCVSGIEWDTSNPAQVYTASWDHSLRLWDLEKENCVRTLNGSKVVTCLSYSPLSHALASGHADYRVRVWDTREGASAMVRSTLVAATSKAWVSDVCWHPTVAHSLASVDHDGLLRLWDTRSPSLPLHTLNIHDSSKGKGQSTTKGLALCFNPQGTAVYAGGEEGCIKSFTLQ